MHPSQSESDAMVAHLERLIGDWKQHVDRTLREMQEKGYLAGGSNNEQTKNEECGK